MQIINISMDLAGIKVQSGWIVPILVFVILVIFCIFCLYKKKIFSPKMHIGEILLSLNIPGVKGEYRIKPNYQNLEIAHHIYVELITRKAAILFDEEHDVIVEVYDSWYSLFGIIREEIKKISGETLFHEGESDDLIRMASDILNKGLRPHLTRYQARFRKWYNEAWENSTGKSPQDIQKEYLGYDEMVENIKQVNKYLIEYKDELKRFIDQSKKI